MLQDELAHSKNQLDKHIQKTKKVTETIKELNIKIQEYEKEAEQWKEFSKVVDQVEQSGANYLAMMKGIKSQLPIKSNMALDSL